MINLPVQVKDNVNVMSSIDLAKMCVGYTKDSHSNFMIKAKKVLGISVVNFQESHITDRGRTIQILLLPEREACLMAMSYSYELQAKVYDAWVILKQAPKVASITDQLAFAEFAIRVMNLQGSAALGVIRKAQENNGIPNMLPDYSVDAPSGNGINSEVGSLVCNSATELLKRNGSSLTAVKFNKMACDAGLLHRESRMSSTNRDKIKYYWSITKLGSQYGKNETNEHNQKETTPRWYEVTFAEVLRKISNL